MHKFKLYLAEIRAPFFTASILPILLGTAVAWHYTGTIHWPYFFLALIGGMALHAGTNIANDYFDHLSGNDAANTEYIRPFSGGSRLIQKGLLRPIEVLLESLVFFALGILIGFYFLWVLGWPIFWLGVVGVFSGFFYTAPPFKLGYRGVGELVVGVNFGILMTLGAYLVQTGYYAWAPVIAALPLTLLIAAVLYINQFPDYHADKKVGKIHWVIILGRERAVYGYVILLTAAYAAVILGILFAGMPFTSCLVFLTLPLAIKAVAVLAKYFNEPAKLVPANAATVMLHALFSGLLVLAYIL